MSSYKLNLSLTTMITSNSFSWSSMCIFGLCRVVFRALLCPGMILVHSWFWFLMLSEKYFFILSEKCFYLRTPRLKQRSLLGRNEFIVASIFYLHLSCIQKNSYFLKLGNLVLGDLFVYYNNLQAMYETIN